MHYLVFGLDKSVAQVFLLQHLAHRMILLRDSLPTPAFLWQVIENDCYGHGISFVTLAFTQVVSNIKFGHNRSNQILNVLPIKRKLGVTHVVV